MGTNNQTVAATGILVQEASYTVIGTDGDGQGDALEGNVISGSILNINLTGTSNLNESHHNRISGNLIGTNASGTASVGIQVEGVRVYVAYDNLIGTDGDGVSDALEGNLISGNSDWGIMLQQTGALNNVVAGNKIGTDITGMASIPNGFGGAPRAGILLGRLRQPYRHQQRWPFRRSGTQSDLRQQPDLHRGHLLQQPAQPRRAADHHCRELDGRERHRPGGPAQQLRHQRHI